MRSRLFAVLAVTTAAAAALSHGPGAPLKPCRRAVLSSILALPILRPLDASALVPGDGTQPGSLLPGELDIMVSPSSYLLKKQARKQKECYDAGASRPASRPHHPEPAPRWRPLFHTLFATCHRLNLVSNLTGECYDEKTFYSIECERDDTECLQRKRRLANRELNNFLNDPFSSPVFLLSAVAFATPWISIVTKFVGRLLDRLFPPADPRWAI